MHCPNDRSAATRLSAVQFHRRLSLSAIPVHTRNVQYFQRRPTRTCHYRRPASSKSHQTEVHLSHRIVRVPGYVGSRRGATRLDRIVLAFEDGHTDQLWERAHGRPWFCYACQTPHGRFGFVPFSQALDL